MKRYDYELHMERLQEHFGEETNLIPLLKVAEYLKQDKRTILADSSFPVKKLGRLYYVSIVSLARWLAS